MPRSKKTPIPNQQIEEIRGLNAFGLPKKGSNIPAILMQLKCKTE